MSSSLDFTGFRVKHEKVGFTEGLSVVLTSRVLQVKGHCKESFSMPILEYNLILQGFNFFYIITMFFSIFDFFSPHLIKKCLYPILL